MEYVAELMWLRPGEEDAIDAFLTPFARAVPQFGPVVTVSLTSSQAVAVEPPGQGVVTVRLSFPARDGDHALELIKHAVEKSGVPWPDVGWRCLPVQLAESLSA